MINSPSSWLTVTATRPFVMSRTVRAVTGVKVGESSNWVAAGFWGLVFVPGCCAEGGGVVAAVVEEAELLEAGEDDADELDAPDAPDAPESAEAASVVAASAEASVDAASGEEEEVVSGSVVSGVASATTELDVLEAFTLFVEDEELLEDEEAAFFCLF